MNAADARAAIVAELRLLRLEFQTLHETGMRALESGQLGVVRDCLRGERELVERQQQLITRYRAFASV